jgi:hypothetical protein
VDAAIRTLREIEAQSTQGPASSSNAYAYTDSLACLANFLEEICCLDDTAHELYKEALNLEGINAFARAKYASFLAGTKRASAAEIREMFLSALVSGCACVFMYVCMYVSCTYVCVYMVGHTMLSLTTRLFFAFF